jgi:hypothetical protein
MLRPLAFLTAALAGVVGVAENVDRLHSLYNSWFGIGPLHLQIADLIGREDLDDDSNLRFSLTFTITKNYGVRASNCVPWFTDYPVVHGSKPFDLEADIENSRITTHHFLYTLIAGPFGDEYAQDIDDPPPFDQALDGTLSLRNEIYVKCDEGVSPIVPFQINPIRSLPHA